MWKAAFNNFMGHSPTWYKYAVLICLALNPLILLVAGPYITGWVILAQFIGTLALALKCYPLIPGGLLALEAVLMGMVGPEGVYHEVEHNLPVILLLLFMVAGIHFMKDLLAYIFTSIIVGIRSKLMLSLTFVFVGAFLSAFLDALTVTAVIIAVAIAFYNIYTSASLDEKMPDSTLDMEGRKEKAHDDLLQFESFLRNLMMHGLVGTALGGVATQVGEPQNLIIAEAMKWDFIEFYLQMAHLSIPLLFSGLLVTILLETTGIFGYGTKLPERVRHILKSTADKQKEDMNDDLRWKIIAQGLVGLLLIVGLALHLAEVGLIGLAIIVLLTTLTGKIHENTIGHAFEEATPFISLLVVFFAIVAMIESVHLFAPVINLALSSEGESQPYFFFAFSGLLSAISDNVFVGTIYIKEAVTAFLGEAAANPDRAAALEALKAADPLKFAQLEKVAIAINVGTNIPSIATPNGQAAFLFLLTNAIAARIKLSYGRMALMAFPYFVVLSIIAVIFLTIDWFPH